MKNNFSKKLKQNKIRTVIEFSQGGIKLVQCLRGEGIINAIYIPLGIGGSEQESATALKKAIKNNHINIGNLWLSLDRSLVAMRLVKLPSVKEEDIRQMVKWQALKILPYKPEEIVVSHKLIKYDQTGFSYVVLVAAPKNTVNKIINVCNALKLVPDIITLSSEGLLEWSRQQRINTKEPTLVLDIDEDNAELIVIHGDKFIFSRSFSPGPSQDEIFIKTKILDGLRSFFEFYRRQKIAPNITKIILSGDISYISKFSSIIESEMNLPIETINRPTNGVSFSSALGLAAYEGIAEVDLVPEGYRDKKLYLKRRKEALKTLILFLYAFLFSIGIIGFNFYSKRKIIEELDRQLIRTSQLAKDAHFLKDETDIINAQINSRGLCLEVLRELYRLIPKDIYLNNFVFEESGGVILKGSTLDMSLVFNFALVLGDSPIFDNAEVKYATQKNTQIGEITDFEITCKLNLDKNK